MKSNWPGEFAIMTSGKILTKTFFSSEAAILNYRARTTGNCICGHKIEGSFFLEDDLGYKWIEIQSNISLHPTKTAWTRFRQWALALISFNCDLKNTHVEHIPNADVFSRMYLTKTTLTAIGCVYTWLIAGIWERLHKNGGYFENQGKILMIVEVVAGWTEVFPERKHKQHSQIIFIMIQ